MMISDIGIDMFLCDYLAIQNFENAMAVVFHVDIMRHHDKRDLWLNVKPHQDIHHNKGILWIQISSWLIQQ